MTGSTLLFPIIVLSVFSGAGKTTLVNHVLANPEGLCVAAIDNDISEVTIDASFDFRDEHVQSLNDSARIDTIVTVVDALNVLDDFIGRESLSDLGEVASQPDDRLLSSLLTKQIKIADVIVISKIDLVDHHQREAVLAVVKALNPVADIVHAAHGHVALRNLPGAGLFDIQQASGVAGCTRELSEQPAPKTDLYGIAHVALRSRDALHPQRFAKFMEDPFPGLPRVMRCIGLGSRLEWAIVYLPAGPNAMLESAGQWSAVAPRGRWPARGTVARQGMEAHWKEPCGDRINEVVFSGRSMNHPAIEQAFTACRLNFTETHKSRAHWRQFTDPFPGWWRTRETGRPALAPVLT